MRLRFLGDAPVVLGVSSLHGGIWFFVGLRYLEAGIWGRGEYAACALIGGAVV